MDVDAAPHVDWFGELSLRPEDHPVAMGVHALGERPWLISDDSRDRELRVKAGLLRQRRTQVLYETESSRPAAMQLCGLVGVNGEASTHPIETAARSVQEDLCLLQRHDDGWHLDASCLCFPTRWHLREKVGKHIAEVHGPVRGYSPRITHKVDRLFDQLTERPVWRRNWFLMTDTTLFQPDRPEAETIIGRDHILDDLYIRSERQTLRRLSDDWIVFTIRIQQETLGTLLTTVDRVGVFANWVNAVSDDFGERRHLTQPQRLELAAALGRSG